MGTIYEIICWTTGLRYIGQTRKTLEERLRQHEGYLNDNNNNCSSKYVLEHGNYEIYELENIRQRELYYINHNDCVNIIDGTFDMKEYQKEYQKEQRESLVEYRKQYHIDNREIILEKAKQYREANKQTLLEKRKETYVCKACGIELTKKGKKRHEKTQRHLENLKK